VSAEFFRRLTSRMGEMRKACVRRIHRGVNAGAYPAEDFIRDRVDQSATSSAQIDSPPCCPMSVTISPTCTGARSVTSTMIISMHTKPTIGARRP